MLQKIAKVKCNKLLFLLSKKLRVKKIARIAKDILRDSLADSGGEGKSDFLSSFGLRAVFVKGSKIAVFVSIVTSK